MTESNEECIGCSENGFSCTEWSHMCPCTKCLVKAMCQESCNTYETFERRCNRYNKNRMIAKRDANP